MYFILEILFTFKRHGGTIRRKIIWLPHMKITSFERKIQKVSRLVSTDEVICVKLSKIRKSMENIIENISFRGEESPIGEEPILVTLMEEAEFGK